MLPSSVLSVGSFLGSSFIITSNGEGEKLNSDIAVVLTHTRWGKQWVQGCQMSMFNGQKCYRSRFIYWFWVIVHISLPWRMATLVTEGTRRERRKGRQKSEARAPYNAGFINGIEVNMKDKAKSERRWLRESWYNRKRTPHWNFPEREQKCKRSGLSHSSCEGINFPLSSRSSVSVKKV